MTSTTLPIYRDARGYLIVLSPYSYCVFTNPGFGRDKEQWHVHQGQTEIFVGLMGTAAVATSLDGERVIVTILDGEYPENQIIIRPKMYHSIITVGDTPSIIAVGRDMPYSADDEGRIPMTTWTWERENWLLRTN